MIGSSPCSDFALCGCQHKLVLYSAAVLMLLLGCCVLQNNLHSRLECMGKGQGRRDSMGWSTRDFISGICKSKLIANWLGGHS